MNTKLGKIDCRKYPFLCDDDGSGSHTMPDGTIMDGATHPTGTGTGTGPPRRFGVKETPRRFGVKELPTETPRRFGVNELPTETPRRFGVREQQLPTDTRTGTRTGAAKAGKEALAQSERNVRTGRGLGYFDKYRTYETKTLESIEQHVYGHFANAAYETYAQKKKPTKDFKYSFKKAEDWIPGMKDWSIDPELSANPEVGVVLVNHKTKEFVPAYRGTDPKNLEDLATDAAIVSGKGELTPRFKQADSLAKRSLNKFKGYKMTPTGHSLGGSLSLFISDKHKTSGHHFDPAFFSEALGRGIRRGKLAKQTIYRTFLDPVSAVSPLSTIFGKNRKIVTVKGSEATVNPHSHEEMLREPVSIYDKTTKEPILNEFGKKQYVTHNGTHFQVKKIPHKVKLGKIGGGVFDLAYLGLAAYETGQKIKDNKDATLNTAGRGAESDEVAFLPIPMSFMEEGSIEQRAIDALGKKTMGDDWHTAADINEHIADERTKKKVLYDGYVEHQGEKDREAEEWADRMNTAAVEARIRKARAKTDAQHVAKWEIDQRINREAQAHAKVILNRDVELQKKEATMFKGRPAPATKQEQISFETEGVE